MTVGSVLRIVARILLIAWAGFWTWFAIAAGAADGRAALPHVATIVGSVVVVALVGCVWPVVGGPLAVAAGVAAWVYFPHPAAHTLLAAPAMVLGVLLFFTRRSTKRTAARPTPA